MDSEFYKVKLENVFEGPMDLLFHLIKKNEVDIYDIPIGLITDQYLEYIEWLQAMNIDMAGDFLVMAATLTQIKSRMLLPITTADEEEEDPRSEITGPLLEYLQMKSAAEQLMDRNLLGDKTFTRRLSKDELMTAQDEEMIKVGLFELIDAFQKILKNLSPDHRVDFTVDKISIKDRIAEIVNMLEKRESLAFEELFETHTDKSDIIVTFLAMLEMVKMNIIRVAQHIQTGAIRIFYL